MKLAPATILVSLLGGDRVAPAAAAESNTCACKAKNLKFNIKCESNDTAMLDALAYLKSNGCAADCSSPECTLHYLVVQSHHDYCPEEKIPTEIEDGFHDYDEQCAPQGCDISRSFIAGAPDCPAPKCDESTGTAAYTTLVEKNCQEDCSLSGCRDNFFVLRTEHDVCDHDTLSRAAEEGLHDMERSCAGTDYACNSASGAAKQLECAQEEEEDDHAGHDHGDEDHSSEDVESSKESGAANAVMAGVAAALVGATAIMI
eukprot:CAMPEP_0172534344 /NCGR_PEP_ID=MMETSP1067-20121228/6746_1 /TAXON_ID=265564 ORGANISM="Thalassiosira punctigera, Strain Tpunct2005C2" /NCGR_SAMPLE_ID=MMETSP1067 /ASSEMBLY_ACC=CAM_ASM_000444 /LENGTH=258 /DNA_ID=CAMNT_0013319123 /DNA_START=40 /DNA_END=816 /DNA_ORIENTATION=+